MRRSIGDVLARLASEGLAPAGAAESARAALVQEQADHLPWFLRVAVGFGAWAATAFLLFALFGIAGLESEVAKAVVGVALIAGASAVRRQTSSEFMRWAAVASALAGQGLIVLAIGDVDDSAAVAGFAGLLVSATIVWLIPDVVLRFLCTLTGGTGFLVWLVASKLPQGLDVGIVVIVAAIAFVWRGQVRERSDSVAEMLEPVGYGLVVVLFGAMLLRTLATSPDHLAREFERELGVLGGLATIGCTVALIALIWRVLEERGASLRAPMSFAAVAGAAVLGAGTLDNPGIVAGAAALMLAFDRRDRILLAMAAIFLVVFGAFYYYSLHLTLLEKSGVLAGSGALLLAIRSRLVRGS